MTEPEHPFPLTLSINRPTSVSTGGAGDDIMVPRRGMETVRHRINELNFRQDWSSNLFWMCLGLAPALGFSFLQSMQVQLLSASNLNLVVAIFAGALFGSSMLGALVAYLARGKAIDAATWQKRHVLEDFDNLLAPHEAHKETHHKG
jgi:hypothetical protein